MVMSDVFNNPNRKFVKIEKLASKAARKSVSSGRKDVLHILAVAVR